MAFKAEGGDFSRKLPFFLSLFLNIISSSSILVTVTINDNPSSPLARTFIPDS